MLVLLAEQAVSAEAKDRCLRVRPETEPEEVLRLLDQTDAARMMIGLHGSPSFSGVKPVAEALDRADRGGSLNNRELLLRLLDQTDAARMMIGLHGSPSFSGVKPVAEALDRADRGGSLNNRELLIIADLLTAARRAKEYFNADAAEKIAIDHLFLSLHGNRFLEEKIKRCLPDEDTVADAASPELADIRRHMRAAQAKSRQILQKIIASPTYGKILQETIITQRDGRFVVPVKAEHKGDLPGLVHDVSAIASPTYGKILQETIITQRDGRFVVPVKAEHKGDLPGLVHDVSATGATVFVEPMGVVQANNEYVELEAKEQKEIDRILAELSALQETIITQRDGRFVVPVKAEHKGDLPGLVHDVSSTGATVVVEPMGVVQANNEYVELEAKEQKEIDRILAELSAEAAAHREDIQWDYDTMVHLDLIFARGQLSYRMNGVRPEVRRDGAIHLRKARHPLLDPKKAVPIDIELGESFDTLVITGPNTGGKTVSLKTLGLLTLMTQCGLHIPVADRSAVSVYDHVLADIGDEQSIEQNLSTFLSMTMCWRISATSRALSRTCLLFRHI